MGIEFKRKLYTRGSSFETTIPLPLLFKLDPKNTKYEVIFQYNKNEDKWYIDFKENKMKKAK